MLKLIRRVIAQLLGLQTQPSDNPVQPTPTAGLAPQTRTRKAGNKPSVATTKPRRQSQPATKKHSSKPKTAQSTKAASSPKAAKKSAPAVRGQSGKPRKTPA